MLQAMFQLVRVQPMPVVEFEVHYRGQIVGRIYATEEVIWAEYDSVTVHAKELFWSLNEHMDEACGSVLAAMAADGKFDLYEVIEPAPVTG